MRKGDWIGALVATLILTWFVLGYFVPQVKELNRITKLWKEDCVAAGGEYKMLGSELHCLRPNAIIDIEVRNNAAH